MERSLAPHDAFELEDVPKIGDKAKKSRGARRRKMVPLAFPEHVHHRIHLAEKDLEKPGEGSGGQPGVATQVATPDPATADGPSSAGSASNQKRRKKRKTT